LILIMILILILRNSELWHAVDYSENSGSPIAELRAISSTLQKKIVVAELWTCGSAQLKK
jgi:hypothetical protein